MKFNNQKSLLLILSLAVTLLCLNVKIGYAQSVTCPPCATGICEGENLASYVTIAGYPTPITITNISGAVSGSGTSLSTYTFSSPGTSIVVQFTDGDLNTHSQTIPVTVNTIHSNFTYNQVACFLGNFHAGSSTSTGTITSYSWTITRDIGGNVIPITTLSGANPTYTFQTAGTYNVCLKITDNHGCQDQFCQNITVSGVDAALDFFKNGTSSQLQSAQNDPFLIPYCNLGQTFNLFGSDNSNNTGGASIANYSILHEGIEVYDSTVPPNGFNIFNLPTTFSGYQEIVYTITDVNGCISTATYQVYCAAQNIFPQFTAQPSDLTLKCPGEEIEIQTNISPDNPDDADYTLWIVCDPNNLNDYLAIWEWEQTEPEANVYWTPTESSCGCPNNSYYLVTSITYPCNLNPIPDDVDFKVALPADADFTRIPSGNLCDQESAQFQWNYASDIDPTSFWCDADAIWTISDENGVVVPINGTNTGDLMSHTFTGAGVYEVCLQLQNSVCGEPLHCETVCVNPPLSDVILSPIWNITDPLCPGDQFTSTLTYNNLPFCATPELTWALYLEGAPIQTFTGLSANVQNLVQGNYELKATFKLEDCGEKSVSEFFEVYAPPVITPQITVPFTAACEGDVICFDEWFCIDDSGIPITAFELKLYQGFLTGCPPNPTATLEETITSSPPNPPYADCDPNTNICSYSWVAVPGQYTLWIKAENHCGPDYACITIDITFPQVPIISGDSEICLNQDVNLTSSLVGGSFQFISCPSGNCPTQGVGAGQYTISGTDLSWTTADGINPPGDYEIEYGGDCIGTGTFTITLNPLPEFTISSVPGSTVCEGDIVTLDINYTGINSLDECSWINTSTGAPISNPDCEVTVNPDPGINEYQVTVTDVKGCETEHSIEIEELTQPFALDCSSIQASYCNNVGATINLNSLLNPYPSSGILEWQFDGSIISGPSLSLDGLAQGNHDLTYTWSHPLSPNCEFTGSCSFDITPPTIPAITVLPEYCAGELVDISVNVPGGIVGNWAFEACPSACPTVFTSSDFSLSWATSASTPAGTYTVSYSGDCLEYREVSFIINPLPVFTISSNALNGLCGGDLLTLDVNYSGSETISCEWTNENTGSQIPNVDCSVTDNPTDPSTTYTVVVTDANTCVNSESIDILIQAQPFVFDCSSLQTVYCDNEVAEIDLADLVNINPSTSGFNWFLNGAAITGNTIDVEALDPNIYTISYIFTHSQAPNCTFEDSCSFTVSPLTTPTITGNDPICQGEEINLTISGTGGFTGTWAYTGAPGSLPTDFTSTPSSLNWITTDQTESGTYTISYTANCLTPVSYSFEINPLPDFTISSNALNGLCGGDLLTLDVNYSGSETISCEWTNENTGSQIPNVDCSITDYPIDPSTTYSVIVTDANTCVNSESIDILIQAQPFVFDCSSLQTVYCDNEVAEIDLADLVNINPSTSGFNWFLNGAAITGNTIDVEALDPNTYTISYIFTHSQAPNCTFEDSCSFIVSPLTTPTITGNDPICQGEEIDLTISGTGGFTGTWAFTGAPGSLPTDYTSTASTLTWSTNSQTESGVYTVEYTANCLTPVSYSFEIYALPDFTILSIPDAIICTSDSVYLSIDYLGNAQVSSCEWTNVDGNIIPSIDCEAGLMPLSDTETYYVLVTDTNACAATDSIELNIQQQPFTFDCSAISAGYCDNELATITFSDLVSIPISSNFEWFLNGTSISGNSLDLEPLSASVSPYYLSYSYTHPDSPHCIFADSCSFLITELIQPSVIGQNTLCINETINLTSANTGGFSGGFTFTDCPNNDCPTNFTSDSDQLMWDTDAAVNLSGIYEIQYTGTCLDTAVFQIEIFPLPPFSVITFPGETVCAEDEITIEFDYQGTSQIGSCSLTDNVGAQLTPDGNCIWTLLPANLEGPYTAILTDDNSCVNEQTFDIDIQQQPFTFSCDGIDATYCDNSTDVITLTDLVSPIPTNGTLEWFLNGANIPTPTLNIYDLLPGNYGLAYTFTHGDAPNCEFTDGCNFTVTPLVQPTLESTLALCLGENILITAIDLNGFEGVWTNTVCPNPPCTLQGNNPLEFTTSSAGLALGTYTMEYAGLCLATTTIDFEVLGNPTVQWIPEDTTPCLNECFEFSEEVLENYSSFGWEYTTFSDQGALTENEVCFPEIGNPASVDICLWADLNHPVQDTVFTCHVEDCHQINPVFSPGNYPEVEEIACPGEVFVIDVDNTFYNDCIFILNDTYTYENCATIDIADNEFGSFPYELFLFYQGCSDTLSGDVFIPEPPTASMEITYDPCIGDALATITNLRGDLLTFNWNVSDVPGNNYDFLMDDDSGELPIPNPIPISELGLYSDTTFYINVAIGNVCETIILRDTVNYISKPAIEIDIQNTAGTQFCLPQDFYFEIGEFATNYIDSVHWTFQSIYDYGNIDAVTYSNLQFPPPLIFMNLGQPDTVVVTATAWNLCGSDGDTINFTLIPPDIYLEMPDYADGVCPGQSITIPSLIVEGDPYNGCEVTSDPIMPGLEYTCTGTVDSITVIIPASTPSGIYTLQTTVFGCGNSTDFTEIEVFPVPEMNFTMVDGACTNSEIAFNNQVEGAVSFEWDFGDPTSGDNSSELSFPTHSYSLPGVYEVTLLAYSDTGCVAELTKPIEIFGPNPAFTIDDAIICSGDSIYTEIEAQNDIISLQWELLSPGTDTLIYTVQSGFSNTFMNQSDSLQFWLVNLEIEDIHGCKASDNAQVIVLPQPHAQFSHGDLNGCAQGIAVQMINESTPGTMSKWSFDDPGSGPNNVSYQRDPTHSFSKGGNYAVTLFVQNSYGCESEYTRLLNCAGLLVYVPNAFTPDENRINEIFKPVIKGIHDIDFTVDTYYTFEIYNRWGKLMFTTHDPDQGWNGHSPDTDYYAESDVYVWQVHIEFPDGAKKWRGSVTLVR